ncbi:MAG: hypothetical protein JWR86_889 [Enterovirga sp.]|jgi:hypothetical protein|nr:hypothetical protein [Enterovirga sp.]
MTTSRTRRAKRLVCHHCSVTLAPDAREHYGYQCHACVVREHELVLLRSTDPDHPDLEWLEAVPVDIGLDSASR